MTAPNGNFNDLSLGLTRLRAGFAGDVLKLVSGTTIAQALGILASPLLTRLYSPEAFGISALFTSLTGIIAVLVCLRYELAIMLPESDEEAANLLGSSMGIAALISLLIIPIVWLAGPAIASALNSPGLAPFLWLIPPVLLFGGLGVGHPALNYWASRTRRFGQLSVTRVLGSITTISAQLGAGLSGYTSSGSLILANVLGSIASSLALAWQIWREDGRLFLRVINWRAMLAGLKRHRKFPLYSTWSALLNTISWQLPALLLSTFFPPMVVGYYSLGFRILQMPMSLIGGAIGQVFFQRATEAKAQGRLAYLVEETFRRLVMIGLFPMLMLAMIGREFYVVVFGQQWAEAGVYTQILSIWAFFWFISSPMSTLFSVLENQEFGLKLNIAIFLTRLGALGIGGYFGNPRLALILFAASGVIVYAYLNFMVLTEAGIPLTRVLVILRNGIMYFAPFGMFISLLRIGGSQAWILLLSTLVSFGGYGLLLVKYEPNLFRVRR